MTHTLNDAQAIAQHYQFLVGRTFAKSMTISHVFYIPEDTELHSNFFKALLKTNNNQIAFAAVAPHGSKAKVLVAKVDTLAAMFLHASLDKYLTDNHIEKIYDEEGLLKTDW